jgi:hypothetical protein
MNWIFYFDPDEVAALVKKSLTAREYIATSEQAMNKDLRRDGLRPVISSWPYTPSGRMSIKKNLIRD